MAGTMSSSYQQQHRRSWSNFSNSSLFLISDIRRTPSAIKRLIEAQAEQQWTREQSQKVINQDKAKIEFIRVDQVTKQHGQWFIYLTIEVNCVEKDSLNSIQEVTCLTWDELTSFHKSMKRVFPQEAGVESKHSRVLPKLPKSLSGSSASIFSSCTPAEIMQQYFNALMLMPPGKILQSRLVMRTLLPELMRKLEGEITGDKYMPLEKNTSLIPSIRGFQKLPPSDDFARETPKVFIMVQGDQQEFITRVIDIKTIDFESSKGYFFYDLEGDKMLIKSDKDFELAMEYQGQSMRHLLLYELMPKGN